MPIKISRIVNGLQPSATLAMSAKAKDLKAVGKTVYDLSVGEPDFKTPIHICAAATAAMQAGHTHYTIASGLPELKKAIVESYKKLYGIEYAPSQVVIANGAKHALHNSLTATLDPGDEVLIPAPYWVSYAELVKLTGAVPIIVQTEESNDFKITPEQLAAVITPQTRMFLLCSPSNPTGSLYSPEELEALAKIIVKNDLIVLSDEIYDQLFYSGSKFASFPTLLPNLQERVILINGVSKTYAMTGWRVGWSISPLKVAKKIGELQSQETSNPCSISQYAAIEALTGDQTCVAEMRAEFEKRRNYVQYRLSEIPDITFPQMGGAFYAFFNIKSYLGRKYNGVKIDTSEQWCLELLTQKNVATVMGSSFGAEGYIRASFAANNTILENAFDRIRDFLTQSTS
ncbi:MAG: pyridoxal phosphate-dependent aminotransferase [Planctomycetaceae bacterium]|jgi:aspartate aminotransferase|nr:pyridoxal phosphate-dependent aminotransferase [Planctomycetaceae bacterium]